MSESRKRRITRPGTAGDDRLPLPLYDPQPPTFGPHKMQRKTGIDDAIHYNLTVVKVFLDHWVINQGQNFEHLDMWDDYQAYLALKQEHEATNARISRSNERIFAAGMDQKTIIQKGTILERKVEELAEKLRNDATNLDDELLERETLRDSLRRLESSLIELEKNIYYRLRRGYSREQMNEAMGTYKRLQTEYELLVTSIANQSRSIAGVRLIMGTTTHRVKMLSERVTSLNKAAHKHAKFLLDETHHRELLVRMLKEQQHLLSILRRKAQQDMEKAQQDVC